MSNIIITARKRSLGQGNIFSSVCQEFCSQGGSASVHAGIPSSQELAPPWEQTPPRADTPQEQTLPWSRHPPEQTTLPLHSACWEIQSTSGWYAFYWNAILFTGRNEVVAKVMFLQVSVIHSVHRGVSRNPPSWDQAEPPWDPGDLPGPRRPPWDQGDPPRPRRPPGPRRPPQTKENPPDQGDPPGPRRTPPDPGDPPTGRRLQHTVNERPVRILLECILVATCGSSINFLQSKLKRITRCLPYFT